MVICCRCCGAERETEAKAPILLCAVCFQALRHTTGYPNHLRCTVHNKEVSPEKTVTRATFENQEVGPSAPCSTSTGSSTPKTRTKPLISERTTQR